MSTTTSLTNPEQYQQFVNMLKQAVDLGQLSPDVLHLLINVIGERGVSVGGDAGLIVTGDHNIIITSEQTKADTPTDAPIDEEELLRQAIADYELQVRETPSRPDASPYMGLREYHFQDAAYFFGRDARVMEVWQQLERRKVRFVWLHGRSGVGKTSFIQAGLLPILWSNQWYPIYVRLLDNTPPLALQKTILRTHWQAQLELAQRNLGPFLQEVSRYLGRRPVLLIFDQFEEFFTRLSPLQREEFATELSHCLGEIGANISFLFSLRGEYFGETLLLRQRLVSVPSFEYQLPPLTSLEACQAIVKPAAMHQISYEPGLAETIVSDLSQQDISPQLQLVARALFDTLPNETQEITADHYYRHGGAKGILENYLRQIMVEGAGNTPHQKWAARYLLSTLVTPEGRRDRRRITEWYNDPVLERRAIDWLFIKKELLGAGTAWERRTLQHLAVDDAVSRIRVHTTSLPEEDLKSLIEQDVDGAVSVFSKEVCREFVDDVVQTLNQYRLVNSVNEEDGVLSYELVHDYLTSEIHSWLDEEAKEARRLERMMSQKQYDFQEHRLLLSKEEMAIAAAQLDNPRLKLSKEDKKILLLSAVAQKDWRLWLRESKVDGVLWLREALAEERLPLAARWGAAACLGEMDDRLAFTELEEGVIGNNSRLPKNQAVYLLAYYMHQAPQPPALPFTVRRALFLPLAILQIREGAAARQQMRRVAIVTAVFCTLFTTLYGFGLDNLLTTMFVAFTFIVLTTILAAVFSEIATSLTLALRRERLFWQLPIVSVIAGAVGFFLFLFMTQEPKSGIAPLLIGLMMPILLRLTLPFRPVFKWGVASGLGILAAGLIIGLTLLIDAERSLDERMAAIVSGLFTTIFLATWMQTKTIVFPGNRRRST